jgi:class 3 adenylate cyclase/tetratricopeptide (TPR) repeat protein
MRCSNCNSGNPDGKRFCGECGSPLGELCPKCGAENPANRKFCGDCGDALAQPTAALRSAERAAALILENGNSHEVPGGERRHLTVLFCDVVDSTRIAAQLDPEEWREIVGQYHRAAAQAIERFGGNIAQYLGDGVMAFFGYPEAHDNDGERAARGGLAILDAVSKLNEHPTHPNLSVRIGIDSGAVVVGTGAGKDTDVFGGTPNIAARVQAAAAPGTVLITADTHRLVSGLFVVEDRGAQTLKGVERPVQLYRVVQPSGVRGRLEAAAGRGLTAFVGREEELSLLTNRWERALDGEGQVALIIGEAGIGKSRLVQRFHEQIADTPHTWVEAAAGPFFQNTPFYPVTEILSKLLSWHGNESAEEQLSQLETRVALAGLKPIEALPLIAPLLNLPTPARYPPSSLSLEQQRRRLLATLVQWVLGAALVQSTVIATEDLHWVDPSTLELIQLLVEQGATSRLLLLYTARPEFRAQWPQRAHHTQITLNRLSSRNVRTIVEEVAAHKALSEETIAAVVERTSGVPLFVEELTLAVLESSNAKLTGREIPVTLHDSLMARLDRLGPAKEIAEVGAVIGSVFSYPLIEAVAECSSEDLQAALDKLVDAELLYQQGLPPDANYIFKHALVQDAAYGVLLKSRRREMHRKVAKVLDQRFKEAAEARPELLAHHYTEAGDWEQGTAAWQRAGEQALSRGALKEAHNHLRSAIAVLLTSPATAERAQRELLLQMRLGQVLQAIKGYNAPETDAAFTRARTLGGELGNPTQLVQILRGHFGTTLMRGEVAVARTLADQLHEAAQRDGKPATLIVGHFDQGVWRYYRGCLSEALEHLQRAVSLWDEALNRAIPNDPGVEAHAYMAAVYVHLGMADKARAEARKGVALAERIKKPFDIAFTRHWSGSVYVMLGDAANARESAELGVAHCKEARVPHFARTCSIFLGWAIAKQGNTGEGIALIQENLADLRAAGAMLEIGSYLALLAEAQMWSGDSIHALQTLGEASTVAEQEIFQPHLLWIRGEVLLRLDSEEKAEQAFRDAIAFSRGIGDKMGELRATTSLARVLKSRGEAAQAQELLAPAFAAFVEGFDTPYIAAAKELLEQKTGSPLRAND